MFTAIVLAALFAANAHAQLPNPMIPAIAMISGQPWPQLDTPPPVVKEWLDLFSLSKSGNLSLPVRKVTADDLTATCPKNADQDPTCAFSCTGCTRSTDITTVEGGKWGLTYDDGPSAYTGEVLDKLKENNLKATFFVVASRVIELPETLQRTYEEGHQIAIHTWSHSPLTSQTNEEIVAEVMWSALAIYSAIGVIPVYFRPPYGDIDDRVRAVIAAMGLKLVVWNWDTSDYTLADPTPGTTPSHIESDITGFINALTPASDGPISLEHDLWKQSAEEGLKVMDILINSNVNPQPVAIARGDESGMFQTPDNSVNSMAKGLASVQLNIPNVKPPGPGPNPKPSVSIAPPSSAAVPATSSAPETETVPQVSTSAAASSAASVATPPASTVATSSGNKTSSAAPTVSAGVTVVKSSAAMTPASSLSQTKTGAATKSGSSGVLVTLAIILLSSFILY